MSEIKMIMAYESAGGLTFNITGDILALDADGVRALVKRWDDRTIEPGAGWPFATEPDESMRVLENGGLACLTFKDSILEHFGITTLSDLTDAMIAEAAAAYDAEAARRQSAEAEASSAIDAVLDKLAALDDDARVRHGAAIVTKVLALQTSAHAKAELIRALRAAG